MRRGKSGSELHGDALLAHAGKDPEQMCDSEKLPNLFAEIDQFEAGIYFFGGNVEADQGAA